MVNPIKVITNSLSYRLPVIYRKLTLTKIAFSKLQKKENSNLTVLLMAGKKHSDYLVITVFSILKYWSVLPKLIISTDGTCSSEVLARKLQFWPGDIFFTTPEETAKYHSKHSRSSISEYADKSAFGKKLAFVIQNIEQAPCLWIDCDIIFYNDFVKYVDLPNRIDSDYFGASEDWTMAYDNFLVDSKYLHLKELPPISTGIFLGYSKNIYNTYSLEELIKESIPNCTHFTEQTILANLCHNSLGVLWSKNLIKNYNEDNQSLKPTNVKDVVCRHYTNNVRHLFWRDAFFNL